MGKRVADMTPEQREHQRVRARAYREEKPDMLRAYNALRAEELKQWVKDNPSKVKDINRRCKLKTKYGLTESAFDALLVAQGGRCKICGEPFGVTKATKAHLDHDHAMPAKDPRSHRGLLCGNCNAGIGLLRDCPDTLRAATAYLENHRAKTTNNCIV
jgi:hypothetical protein